MRKCKILSFGTELIIDICNKFPLYIPTAYSVHFRDLIDEAKDYHLIPERRNQLQTFRRRPRCHSGIIGIIYAVGGLTSSGRLTEFI